MALPGIPIPETECIGDSLFSINNALTALDASVIELISAGASVTVQETPPSGASAGDLWFDSSSGVTSVYYDGTWVDVGGGDSGTSAGSVNGIVKSDGAGNFSAAVAGTDYLTSASLPTSRASVKAWVYFQSNGTIVEGYNVTSVTNPIAGKYRINFTTGLFANANYVFAGTTRDVNDDGVGNYVTQLNSDLTNAAYCELSIMRDDSVGRNSQATRVAFFGA